MSVRRPLPNDWLDEELKFKSMLLDGAIDSVFVFDLEGRILFANASAYETRGYTKDELIGMTLAELDPPQFRPMIKERLAYIVKVGHAQIESAHTCKDGAIMPVEIHARAIDFNGRTLIYSIIRDITERKKAEASLRLFSQAVEEATDVIQIIDLDGHIIYSNKAVEKTYGFTSRDLEGEHIDTLSADPNLATQAVLPALKKRGRWIGEVLIRRKDGHSLPVWLSASVVRDADGKSLAVVCIARNISDEKRARELSEALNLINQQINSTLDFDRIMQRVVVEATEAIGSESGMVLLKDNSEWVLKTAHGLPSEHMGRRFTESEAKATELAVKTKKPVVINDAANDERVNPEVMRELNIHSLMAVPLILKEEAIGAMLFQYHSMPVAFKEADVDFARKLAVSVGLSVANARLFAIEQNIADTLQEALLTVPERINKIDFGHLYRSATESARVGGDFYDIFEIDDDMVAVLIGDVSGKGLAAAALTSAVKNSIKAFCFHEASPAVIVSKTNDLIAKSSGASVFVTLFLALIDTRTGGMVYCNAGHPPGLLRRHAGTVATLETRSPAIGIFGGMVFSDSSLVLKAEDMLILYTDGIVEARYDRDFYGEAKLLDFIKSVKNPNAKTLPGKILKSVRGFTGGPLQDDIAIIVVSPKS